MVRALIEAGADVNKPCDNSMTPLYFAAEKGHEAIVRALMEAGADVNSRGMTARRHCTPPLKRATRR